MYPQRKFDYQASVRYSGRFSDYNAHVELRYGLGHKKLEFKLCKKWKDVSVELKIGLIQELLVKLFKRKNKKQKPLNTLYIDMYNSFIKNVHIAIPKTNIDPSLAQSFDRLNERYFLGVVEKPNLVWGNFTKSKLGSYDFKNDTITITSALKSFIEERPEFIDIVMYHEMLHKQNKFKACNGRTLYHDKRFKQAEKMFDNFEQIEKNMHHALRYVKRPKGTRLPFERKIRNNPKGIFNRLFS